MVITNALLVLPHLLRPPSSIEELGKPYDEARTPGKEHELMVLCLMLLCELHAWSCSGNDGGVAQAAEIECLFREPIHLMEDSCMHDVIQYLRFDEHLQLPKVWPEDWG